MSSFLQGATPPAPIVKKEVIRVTTAETSEFAICSTAAWGQWVHWNGHRSSECFQDRSRTFADANYVNSCIGCKDGLPSRFQVYLHVWDWACRKDCYLEITGNAWRQLEEKLDREKPLRGTRFSIRRTKGGAKGRYVIDVREARADPANLPEPLDPLNTLRRLWNFKKGPSKVA